MKTADIKRIRKKMEKSMDAHRFEHTLGVTYTAACLAMRYNVDIMKAQTAGLLHDCAKCMSNEKRLSICKKHIADYIEPGRKQAPNLPEVRKMAFVDLDKALLMILEDTLTYLQGTNNVVDPMTQKTYDYYKQKMEESR